MAGVCAALCRGEEKERRMCRVRRVRRGLLRLRALDEQYMALALEEARAAAAAGGMTRKKTIDYKRDLYHNRIS